MPEITPDTPVDEIIKQEFIDEIYNLEEELKRVKKKSDTRKRHLRDLNKKIELYIALADAAISDAARYKCEYERLKEKLDGFESN